MSEAVWIEVIKVLPAFLWIGFAFIALAVFRRLLTQQAPRMTRVQTPWATVEFAQQVIEEVNARNPVAPQPPPPETDWSALFPPIPTQQAPAESGLAVAPVSPGTAPGGPAYAGRDSGDAPEGDDTPAPFTEPRTQAPDPLTAPTDPRYASGGLYHARPAGRNGYAPAPLPPFQQALGPQSNQDDYRRSLSAATRLALAIDVLEGGAILWVDDHPEHNESLAALFERVGVRVDAVLTTEAAAQALSHTEYDLVISDVERSSEPAGRRAGYELLDRIAKLGLTVPVVFYTKQATARGAEHPGLAAATSLPEDLVHFVVDFVGHRPGRSRNAAGNVASNWFDRLRG